MVEYMMTDAVKKMQYQTECTSTVNTLENFLRLTDYVIKLNLSSLLCKLLQQMSHVEVM